jgi:hypothetical protein
MRLAMPDVEQMLVAWLGLQFPGSRFVTEAPADSSFSAAVAGGLVRVQRVGGPRMYAIDRPTVVIDCFKPDRPAAKALALQVADALYLRLPGVPLPGGVVGHVAEISGPSWVPWDDTNVRRVVATYQIHLKAA